MIKCQYAWNDGIWFMSIDLMIPWPRLKSKVSILRVKLFLMMGTRDCQLVAVEKKSLPKKSIQTWQMRVGDSTSWCCKI